jgi:hypothetical protein
MPASDEANENLTSGWKSSSPAEASQCARGLGFGEQCVQAGIVWARRTAPHFGDFDSGEGGHR